MRKERAGDSTPLWASPWEERASQGRSKNTSNWRKMKYHTSSKLEENAAVLQAHVGKRKTLGYQTQHPPGELRVWPAPWSQWHWRKKSEKRPRKVRGVQGWLGGLPEGKKRVKIQVPNIKMHRTVATRLWGHQKDSNQSIPTISQSRWHELIPQET